MGHRRGLGLRPGLETGAHLPDLFRLHRRSRRPQCPVPSRPCPHRRAAGPGQAERRPGGELGITWVPDDDGVLLLGGRGAGSGGRRCVERRRCAGRRPCSAGSRSSPVTRCGCPATDADHLVVATMAFDQPSLDRLRSLVFKPVSSPMVRLDGRPSSLVVGTMGQDHLLRVPVEVGGRRLPVGRVGGRSTGLPRPPRPGHGPLLRGPHPAQSLTWAMVRVATLDLPVTAL